MGNRVLVRSDGSTVVVPEAEAQKLLTLGYRDQTPGEELGAGIDRGYEEYYTSPGQKALTGLEGLASGASLGLSDLVLDSEATRDRARYNPGTRIATELIGGLAPLVPGVGSIAKYTPAGLLATGAESVGNLAKGGKVINAIARGGVEGAGLGAGASITTAKMDGDPLTAEAVLAGMGWGTLFGGGLAGLGSAVAGHFESRTAQQVGEVLPSKAEIIAGEELGRVSGKAKVADTLQEGMRAESKRLGAIEDGHYQRLADEVHGAVTNLKGIKTTVESAVTGIDFKGLNRSQTLISNQLTDSGNIKLVKSEARKFATSFSKAQQAAKEGKYEQMIQHLESFKQAMAGIEGTMNPFFSAEKVVGQANDLIGLAKYRLEGAAAAAGVSTEIAAVHETLKGFPRTADDFVKMTPKSMEKLSAGVDSLMKLKPAELAGIQQAVGDAVDHLGVGMGVTIEGTAGTKLSGLWKLLKDGRSARATEALKAAQEGKLLWNKVGEAERRLDMEKGKGLFTTPEASTRQRNSSNAITRMAGYGAGSWAAGKVGYGAKGAVAYTLGKELITGLAGLKGAVLGKLSDVANKWVPRGAKALHKYGPRLEPLKTRIDGTTDVTGDREALMRARAKELNEAAPAVRDTIFRAVQPLNIEHPELAAAVHAHAVARFQFLLSKLPKDPGLAFNRLQSLWKPDQVATEKFSRYYEVFQNPVAVAVKAMETGKVTLEAAEGLREMNPELWTQVRSNLLYRISHPEVLGKMSYDDQVHMGILLGINLHSTMNPQFIAAQQQMFTERNQPLEMNPRVQPGGGAGRPSGGSPGPSATAAQRITEH